MIQRVALFAASLTAALVLVAGLVLAGFAPGGRGAGPTGDPVAATAAAPTDPPVQVDTVYVGPTVRPRETTVIRTARASGGDEDHEHEGGGDD